MAKGKPAENWIKRICLECGNEFLAEPYQVRRGRAKYCSRTCTRRVAGRIGGKISGGSNAGYKGNPTLTNYEHQLNHKGRYPEKDKARKLARLAVRKGILVRQPCEVCGTAKVEIHHEDYSKPLDVRWLCRKHHLESHGGAWKKPQLIT